MKTAVPRPGLERAQMRLACLELAHRVSGADRGRKGVVELAGEYFAWVTEPATSAPCAPAAAIEKDETQDKVAVPATP